MKLGGFGLVLVIGWVFILWANNFHVTAPVVMVCLAYLCGRRADPQPVAHRRCGGRVRRRQRRVGPPIGANGELEKEKKTLLKAIKEAEFDLAMGKLSKRDSESLIKQYRARAIEVIKELDHVGDGAELSPREQIEREVKARRELAAQDKPSKRVKNAARRAKAAEAKGEKVEAKVEPSRRRSSRSRRNRAEPCPRPSVRAKGETAAANAEIVELSLDDIDTAKALIAASDDIGTTDRSTAASASSRRLATTWPRCSRPASTQPNAAISVRRAGESP